MKNDGGPAFPAAAKVASRVGDYISIERYTEGGMSTRDYFAIHADQMDLSVPVTVEECANLLGINPEDYKQELHYPEVAARCRYAFADAMLKERSRE